MTKEKIRQLQFADKFNNLIWSKNNYSRLVSIDKDRIIQHTNGQLILKKEAI